MIERHLVNHSRAGSNIEVDHRRPRCFRRCCLCKDSPFQPWPECQDRDGDGQDKQANSEAELDSGVTTLVHGGSSRAACAVISKTKSGVNGVHESKTARPLAVTVAGPTAHRVSTESPIRPPSNWPRTSSILSAHASTEELIAAARAPWSRAERRAPRPY
jgi:hypothetical protein